MGSKLAYKSKNISGNIDKHAAVCKERDVLRVHQVGVLGFKKLTDRKKTHLKERAEVQK